MASPAATAERLPVYWFFLLQKAVDEGDFVGAIHAIRELEQLGVHVRYGRPRPSRPRTMGGPDYVA
jgi:hypothetical protein